MIDTEENTAQVTVNENGITRIEIGDLVFDVGSLSADHIVAPAINNLEDE